MARVRAKARTTSARARASHESSKSNYGMFQGGGKANSPSSYGPVKGYQKGDGKSGGKGPRLASATPAVEIILPGIAPKMAKVARKEDIQGTRSLGDLGSVLSLLREAPPKHAGPQRVPQELRKNFMTCADMNCNCKGGHQQTDQECKLKDRMENGR